MGIVTDIPFFGTAGNADSFFEAGFKDLIYAPEYLNSLGLDAYEYQGGRGIRIPSERAALLGQKAKEFGVRFSIHAPYYISMSGTDEEKRLGSIGYIIKSAQAAYDMGADRVVVHCGSCGKISRGQALELAKDTFKLALDALKEQNLSGVHLCPETMGKVNQLGTVDEVVEICKIDESLIPCIDFGHVYARNFGALVSLSDFEAIFDSIENGLGEERLKSFHSHFSHIEYTEKGGEKRHLTFEDTSFGPEFEPVAELCCKKSCRPVFICESSGTQAVDACKMKETYLKKVGENK
jgi:deoxyribonuclease IV